MTGRQSGYASPWGQRLLLVTMVMSCINMPCADSKNILVVDSMFAMSHYQTLSLIGERFKFAVNIIVCLFVCVCLWFLLEGGGFFVCLVVDSMFAMSHYQTLSLVGEKFRFPFNIIVCLFLCVCLFVCLYVCLLRLFCGFCNCFISLILIFVGRF